MEAWMTSRPPTTQKVHRRGTHRNVPPEQTWERVAACFADIGVTRIADVTHLDTVGIPVSLGIRPRARTLAVSMGKGLTQLLARVGAAMESVELWCAEHAELDTWTSPARDLSLPYRLDELQLCQGSLCSDELVLTWTHGTEVRSGTRHPVPVPAVVASSVCVDSWSPPTFLATSNGLASGNTYDEAALHALLELVERDCLRAFHRSGGGYPRLALADVGPDAGELLDLLVRDKNLVEVLDVTGPQGIPCYHARIRNDTIPITFIGAGCHTDSEVALCRALTEAAQNRLSVITGSRDDLDDRLYEWQRDHIRTRGNQLPDVVARPMVALRQSIASESLRDDLVQVADRVMRVTGKEPVIVDLTHGRVGIPVVRVVAPGLQFNARTIFRPERPQTPAARPLDEDRDAA
jgi:ribosomal protein S12 methylthiotransferase accessory factor